MNRHLLALLLLAALPVHAIPRDEVLVRARTYATHPWHCSAANVTGGCGGGYTSVYAVGDYVGLPYDWGGYASIDQFDRGVDAGKGVGSYPADGILDCTVGVDCSGFVSRAWKAPHTTTSGMDTITSPITAAQLKPADAYNATGYHVMLFERVQANGDPQFIESVYYNVHTTFWEPWTYVADFDPVRYDDIEDQPAVYADGTADHPVQVGSFPFVDERDTTLSSSDLFDACLGAAPSTQEQGPEVVYRVEVTTPGTLTAAVQDDGGVDVDVHVYRALNELDCVARNDKTVSLAVGCGTIYVVVDTYTAAGGDQPGPYALTIDLEPSGQPCGAPDPAYEPGGAVGEACDYDGSGSLPFCNPNLGAVVCIYSSAPGGGSFCSYPCAAAADCAADFPGGCCEEVDVDYRACLPVDWCTPPQPDAGDDLSADTADVASAEVEPIPEPVADTASEAGPEVVPEASPEAGPDAGADTPSLDLPPAHDAAPHPDGHADPDPTPDATAADTPEGPGSPDAGSEGTGGSAGCATGRGESRGTALALTLLAVATLASLSRRRKGLYLEIYTSRSRVCECPSGPIVSPPASSEPRTARS